MSDSLPLAHVVVTKIRRTSHKPSEWIATTADGEKVYILADKSHLHFGVGALNDVLRNVKDKKAMKVKHTGFTSAVSTPVMLKVTGLQVPEGIAVNEIPVGATL